MHRRAEIEFLVWCISSAIKVSESIFHSYEDSFRIRAEITNQFADYLFSMICLLTFIQALQIHSMWNYCFSQKGSAKYSEISQARKPQGKAPRFSWQASIQI